MSEEPVQGGHPDPRATLTAAVSGALGCPASDLRLSRMSGGCINHAFRVDGPWARVGFLKWRSGGGTDVFEAEVDGLALLRAVSELRVPEVWAWDDSAPLPWLLMEFVPAARSTPLYWDRLGSGIAALHGATDPAFESGSAGWHRDNWIGSLPQANTPANAWPAFFVERRLRPQVQRALLHGRLAVSPLWDELLEATREVLERVDAPMSRLHGDLWSGNVYPDTDGRPVVIDPAVYVGHREVDLAMVDLFGGFAGGFHRSYRDRLPVPAAYGHVRRALYQTYPLLVHVNLFGGVYAAQAESAARDVIGAVG